ncbi:4-hydroxythreonine-4-phosphate dehydrogenase PdxA [Blochmannia endosymbiont of Polyrhachis (Hedomyrma) turneri]|uniref:4-hydroxythreonine-4-phosphate dehydrogenase PdxA n=1 Tax=Blochmannia endosymbiont of Polyrhachis (Hedomyrma) turneri TaxID=1505596 RepID=UPI00061A6382|nr:4-hydroxythreonine-4-phosphate dehydrogenase PdxA [Blochmannia endosymbiont of Polyrhachis (Hedomyrma) turneri]AKC59710.1 4-hydroxythreonine-4-phosphate dehydrogenase [Blochmannia endosymbiont of Polyrhachis (Hedomyrma) turneri]
MTNNHRPIVITPGEPAGIGPDLTIMIAQKKQKWPIEIVICADPNLLINRAKQLNLPIQLHTYQNKKNNIKKNGELTILPINAPDTITPGKLNINNSKYVINTLTRACQGCLNGEFSALVTGPIHKATINESGISFIGHTEFLANYTQTKKVVMMFTDNQLRIALMTTHLPISKITQFITKESLSNTIIILAKNLKKYFNISTPKIIVSGLNPHAGENGYLGQEEKEIIIPTLNTLRNTGYDLTGPLPIDTIFIKKYLKHADAILVMYHDQGIPILKFKSFGKSTNITLGLPFIRTSVDHGTAIELAGTKYINTGSINMAIKLAIQMINKSHEKNFL